jgi:S1/P1 Nuclease
MLQHIRIFAIALTSALLVMPRPAWSWGSDGHRTVGMIADLILKDTPTGDSVIQILGTSLSEASVFADCAKGQNVCQRPLSPDEQDFVHRNPQHHDFHFTDVAIQQTEYRLGAAGTRENDVVQIIKQSVNILRDRAPNQGPAILTKKQALWVLAHMVGDVHQPLHVGAIYFDQSCEDPVDPNVVGAGQPNFGIGTTVVSTNGGNELKMPNGDSFHVKYWDEGTVKGAMRLPEVRAKTIDQFAAKIVARPPTDFETTGDVETWSAKWATEILPIANTALTKIDIGEATLADSHEHKPKCTWPITLTKEYTRWANQQALTQLGKAGFRLAAVLRAIFENH